MRANPPDISVVMSVYNNADTLAAALESILSQKGVELEFIVIDDGSTDGSGKILDEAAARDSQLKVVHKKNEGLTRALIAGCAMAQGRYIARQDADDISLPGRLRQQFDFMEAHAEVVLCTCGTRVVAPEGEVVAEIVPEGSIVEQSERLRDSLTGVPSHGCCMFRRDAYVQAGGYHRQFYYAQDADLWLRLIATGHLGGVPRCLYELREGISSISVKNRSFQKQFCQLAHEAYRARRQGIGEKTILERADQVRTRALEARKRPGRAGSSAEAYRLLAARLRCNGNIPAAGKYLKFAAKAAPLSLRVWREWARLFLKFS
jgi:cellulose synthase/poly-beta-1,6-N-acetylglucosamine synthase-like glycosyltransferase